MIDDEQISNNLAESMEKSMDNLSREFKRIRTGRASISLLDGIHISYHGSNLPLNQLATLSIPDPRLIAIQPWDSSILQQIEKAILKSELGLTPVNDGRIIKIPVPSLTEERRKELVKIIRRMGEESKVSLRNLRRDTNEKLKKMKKEKDFPEDQFFRLQEEVQKITIQYISKVDRLLEEKEREILEL